MMALYLEYIADHQAVAEATLQTQITDKDKADIFRFQSPSNKSP